MKSNQIKRGVFQSLYRYLPNRWIDFSITSGIRKTYTAKVVRWSSDKLVHVNEKRLLRAVSDEVESFDRLVTKASNGQCEISPTLGFGSVISTDTFSVLSPKTNTVERSIVAEVSPLTYFCQKCKRVRKFKSSQEYLSNRQKQKCEKCDMELTQVRQIYFCKCGWASDDHDIRCRIHGARNIIRFDNYNFSCKECGQIIPMRKKCESCGAMLYPKPALDSAQYFPKNFPLIDLISEEIEEFIYHTDNGSYLVIAYWLGYITQKELSTAIKQGITVDEEDYKAKYDELYAQYKAMNLEETMIINIVNIALKAMKGNTNYDEAIDEVKGSLLYNDIRSINRIAENIYEYQMVCDAEERSTLDDAIVVAGLLNTSANPYEFKDIALRYGIINTQVCGKLPFVFTAYGYTREKTSIEKGVRLIAFPEEKIGMKNIYAAKLDTEGVLFEFDRKMIVEWLLKNKYITVENSPNMADERDLKLWFLNNIKPDAIKPFEKISEDENPEVFYVYSLIHSISHLLIKQAAELSGLDKNSISEYIFPNVPAVLIYCQNSQGFNLGALYNLFEANFDKWIKYAASDAQKCIFDPICTERYKACAGCLFLNEVSCQHFNKDLDRSFIVGMYDKLKNQRHYGFWEEV